MALQLPSLRWIVLHTERWNQTKKKAKSQSLELLQLFIYQSTTMACRALLNGLISPAALHIPLIFYCNHSHLRCTLWPKYVHLCPHVTCSTKCCLHSIITAQPQRPFAGRDEFINAMIRVQTWCDNLYWRKHCWIEVRVMTYCL